jgi:hypothetical protein
MLPGHRKQNKAGNYKERNLRRSTMNNYVIRVYRKDTANTNSVTGIIENTMTLQQKSFRDLAGLQAAIEDFIGTDTLDHAGASQIDMYGFEEAVANG